MKTKIEMVGILLIVFLAVSGCSGEAKVVEEPKTTEEGSAKVESEEMEILEVAIKNEIVIPKPPEDYSYEISMSGDGVESIAKYWFRGKDYRMEMDSEEIGQNIIIISSEKDKALYMIYPEMKMATKMAYEVGTDSMDEFFGFEPIEYDESFLKDYLKFEELSFDGQDAYYFEMKDSDLEEKRESISKVWFSKKYGLPLKMENYLEGSLVYSSTIANIEIGPFDEGLFQVPEGMKIKEL